VTLGESGEFIRLDLGYAAVVHVAGRNVAFLDEFAEPRAGFRIVVIVVRTAHRFPLRPNSAACVFFMAV
jgi:hypothetical protein